MPMTTGMTRRQPDPYRSPCCTGAGRRAWFEWCREKVHAVGTSLAGRACPPAPSSSVVCPALGRPRSQIGLAAPRMLAGLFSAVTSPPHIGWTHVVDWLHRPRTHSSLTVHAVDGKRGCYQNIPSTMHGCRCLNSQAPLRAYSVLQSSSHSHTYSGGLIHFPHCHTTSRGGGQRSTQNFGRDVEAVAMAHPLTPPCPCCWRPGRRRWSPR